MSHTKKPYGFVAYFDEAGDDGLSRVRPVHPDGSSEWFIISAVVVQTSNENAVGTLQRDILSKFHNSQKRDIHYRKLSEDRKAIACQEVGAARVRCFVVMSNKKNIIGYRNQRTAPEKNYLYWWLTRILLERVTRFCGAWSQRLYGEPRPIKMIFSQRGGMSYDRLLAYLNLIRFQTEIGQLYLDGEIDWGEVDLKQIYVAAHVNEAGLQIADIVAGAFFQAVSMDGAHPCKSDYAKLLVPRLHRGRHGKVILGYGVKPMPSLRRMKLLLPQRAIFEFVGYPKSAW